MEEIMKKILSLIAVLCVLCLAVAGCGSQMSNDQKHMPTKKPGTFRIVTSFYPIYVATLNVAKGVDGVEVVDMTKPQTGCLHDYQLSTEDMKTLAKADIFVINGGGMESFLQKVADQEKDLKCIDASQGIEFIKDADGEDNPHVWVSVTYEIQQVKNIATGLAAADPEHADQYRENALAYVQKLEGLRQEMHEKLDNLPHKDIVTFHEAFPYFAREFKLNIAASIEHEPGTEPTPGEIKDTVAKVNALPVKVLFTEPQYSSQAAEAIARETGARIFRLDPLVTGDTGDGAADAYLDGMRKNMEVLQEALQ
jgi:zinc transport system substrate-binding protein